MSANENDAPAALFSLWRRMTKNELRQLEPWLRTLVEDRLSRFSAADLETAIRGALTGATWEQRKRRGLNVIFKTDALIRSWIRSGTSYGVTKRTPSKALSEGRRIPAPRQPELATGLRMDLAVDFNDNAKAKALGAKWDGAAQSWFYVVNDATTDDQLRKLRRWAKHPNLLNPAGTAAPAAAGSARSMRRKIIENEVDRDGFRWGSQSYTDEVERRAAAEGV